MSLLSARLAMFVIRKQEFLCGGGGGQKKVDFSFFDVSVSSCAHCEGEGGQSSHQETCNEFTSVICKEETNTRVSHTSQCIAWKYADRWLSAQKFSTKEGVNPARSEPTADPQCAGQALCTHNGSPTCGGSDGDGRLSGWRRGCDRCFG